MSGYTEDELIEQPAIELLGELGYEVVRCFNERFGKGGTLGRANGGEVVLVGRLRAALERLNPGVTSEAIEGAVEEVARDRSALNPVHANREVYGLLKDGVKVTVRDERGEEGVETVRVIDWNEPGRNDFLLASQLWVSGEVYQRRADLVGFVNGLPLVVLELKASHKRLNDAFDDNLTDYKQTIPQLFWYNAFVILSNGSESKIGTMTSAWEHFAEWKRINDEGEKGIVSLETMIRGTCEPGRLLDLVENFTLYSDAGGGTVKLVAKNHQYLGVNRAFGRLREMAEGRGVPSGEKGAPPCAPTTVVVPATAGEPGGRKGRVVAAGEAARLGVFWHTQGSGKSYSMVFFSQKVLRKVPGDWTFVVVTDRQELDDQIYGTFAGTGAVARQEGVHAESGADLQRLLRENHRVVFTLIQKFRTGAGEAYPVLSERSDVVVMTDEAHRTQYATLAMNMRRALPKAAFIAFTGTPLIIGEEATRDLFGPYVSIYNFLQAVEDGATVPLYYENRVPEVQLTNEDLNDDLEALIEAAELDEDQERRLEREFAREYHLITRNDRLERIAADVVEHYLGRFEATGGRVGKAMVVAIDKATAVRMYDKVRARWEREIAELEDWADDEIDPAKMEKIMAKLDFMRATDMAVVVSQAQNEEEEFAKKGLDIRPHRMRMVKEDLEAKFKDADDPFRIVFVTAMWMTGFDVPSLETIYLDKPLRNHTLMQTIARANRVFAGKTNGLIVDYVGIFRDLEKALAIYGSEAGGGVGKGDRPVRPKEELVAKLAEGIEATIGFLQALGVEVEAIQRALGWAKLGLLDDAREAILVNDATKARYLGMANGVELLYKAVLPDPVAQEFAPVVTLFRMLTERIRILTPEVSIEGVMRQVEELLDASIATEGYVIREDAGANIVDLSTIDFEGLRKAFGAGRKHTEVERLRSAIERKLKQLVAVNKTRIDYLERLQALIDAYNAGAMNVQLYFDELMAFAKSLSEEEQRAIANGLSEEELAVFDLLTKPGPTLTAKEEEQVRTAARELLAALKRGKLVLDWRKKQTAKAQVQVTIQRMLAERLPKAYTLVDMREKSEVVYQHVYDAYSGEGRGTYA